MLNKSLNCYVSFGSGCSNLQDEERLSGLFPNVEAFFQFCFLQIKLVDIPRTYQAFEGRGKF